MPSLADGAAVSYQSYNFPLRYIRHRDSVLRIDEITNEVGSEDATFRKIKVSSSSVAATSLSSSSRSSSLISSVSSSRISSVSSSKSSSLRPSSVSSSRASSSVPAGVCVSIPQYVDGSSYNTNAIVKNVGNRYQCKVGGWCSIGGPYAPGQGWAWDNAWSLLGICN